MIIRKGLLEGVKKDIKDGKMVYLWAPCGWGKTFFLRQLTQYLGDKNCKCLYPEDISENEVNISEYDDGSVVLVDQLEEWVVSGRMKVLEDIIRSNRDNKSIIMAGRIPLPGSLLPYKLTSQIMIYEKEQLQYSIEEVRKGCPICTLNFDRKQITQLYEISNGMPLFWAVMENDLKRTEGN